MCENKIQVGGFCGYELLIIVDVEKDQKVC